MIRPTSVQRSVVPVMVLLVSALAGFTAVSSESFWIDEANSALKALQPSLASWWHVLVAQRGSDLQMPLYMLQLWAWEKICGSGEFALRSVNIVWLCLGQGALLWAFDRRPRFAVITGGLGALSPLLWFYLNDARPYLMQYAGACLLCAVLFRATEDPMGALRSRTIWVFGAGLFVLCGSSLLGVIWAAGALVAWIFLVGPARKNLAMRQLVGPVAATLTCLTFLGGFYLWTIWLGAGASKVGDTRFLNLAFISYEFSGVAGLGPGRLQIRQDGFEAFQALSSLRLFAVVAASFLSLGVFLIGMWAAAKRLRARAQIAGLLYTLLPGLLLLVFGCLLHFRLLGRHFIPLLPPVLGLMTLGIVALASRRRSFGIAAGIALSCVWLVSDLSLRFGERHRKDDYRTAAEVAKAALAASEVVWWSADSSAAIYYEVPIHSPSGSGGVFLMIHPTADDLARLSEPNTVIASKPDLYDGQIDNLADYLAAHAFTPTRELPAFTIWRRRRAAPAGR
ncbi:MAG: hypothetical protein ABI946_01070 [Chthoniobacterales bacterium]